MKKLFKIMLVSSLSLLCFSCYYDEEVIIERPPVSEAKFANDILPIIEDYNCVDCHNASRDPDLTAGKEYASLLDGFVTPFDAAGSSFYTFLADGHRDVDATSLAKIELWINEGALNN